MMLWALIDDPALLEALAGGLEQRGVREKELKAALEKVRSGREVATY